MAFVYRSHREWNSHHNDTHPPDETWKWFHQDNFSYNYSTVPGTYGSKHPESWGVGLRTRFADYCHQSLATCAIIIISHLIGPLLLLLNTSVHMQVFIVTSILFTVTVKPVLYSLTML